MHNMALPLDILRSVCLIRPEALFVTKLGFPDDVTKKLRLELLRERHARGGTLLWPDCLGRVDDALLELYFTKNYFAPSESFDVALVPTVRRLIEVGKDKVALWLVELRQSTRLFMEVIAKLAERMSFLEWETMMKAQVENSPETMLEYKRIVFDALWKRRDIEKLAAFLNMLFEARDGLDLGGELFGPLRDAVLAGNGYDVSTLVASLRPRFWHGVSLVWAFEDTPLPGSVIAAAVDLREMATAFAYQTDFDAVGKVLRYMDSADIDWDVDDLRGALHPDDIGDFEEIRQMLAVDFPHRFAV